MTTHAKKIAFPFFAFLLLMSSCKKSSNDQISTLSILTKLNGLHSWTGFIEKKSGSYYMGPPTDTIYGTSANIEIQVISNKELVFKETTLSFDTMQFYSLTPTEITFISEFTMDYGHTYLVAVFDTLNYNFAGKTIKHSSFAMNRGESTWEVLNTHL